MKDCKYCLTPITTGGGYIMYNDGKYEHIKCFLRRCEEEKDQDIDVKLELPKVLNEDN